MQGLSVELIIQTIVDFWPFFATVALVFLLIFHLGAVCRRLEKEVGLQRARIKELMLMFQELQKMRPPVLPTAMEKGHARVAETAARTPQENPPVEPVSQSEEGTTETTTTGYVKEEPPAEETTEEAPAAAPAPPEKMFQQEVPPELRQEEPEAPEPRPVAAEPHDEEPHREQPQEPVPPAAPSRPAPERAVVACENCGNRLAYPRALAGKRAKCPACKTVIRLP